MFRATLSLGSIRGINVGLHWSIAVVAYIVVTSLAGSVFPEFAPGYSRGAYFLGATIIGVLFLASIVAHEFGHSIVAQRNGVGVGSITLFALGGVATLESQPQSPGAAARIAAAGPAVSVAVAVASGALAVLANMAGASSLLVAGLAWLGLINGTLAVFNMLPALPLDGGRVLQSALWKRSGDRNLATISAAKLGRLIGWGLVLFGLWQFSQGGSGLMTAVVGWFIVGSAKAESMRARLRLRQNQFQDHFGAYVRDGQFGQSAGDGFGPPTGGGFGPPAGDGFGPRAGDGFGPSAGGGFGSPAGGGFGSPPGPGQGSTSASPPPPASRRWSSQDVIDVDVVEEPQDGPYRP